MSARRRFPQAMDKNNMLPPRCQVETHTRAGGHSHAEMFVTSLALTAAPTQVQLEVEEHGSMHQEPHITTESLLKCCR